MGFDAKVIKDSISEDTGVRLTTLQVTFPRFVLAEVNTHRSFSRNSASSRAIPTPKLIERVEQDPFVPSEWGINRAGMQADDNLDEYMAQMARSEWLAARDSAVEHVRALQGLKVHKQLVNRPLEPFLWHTAIISATEWDGFFEQRFSPGAQPEFRITAEKMQEALNGSTPTVVGFDGWHIPWIQPDEEDLPLLTRIKLGVARSARVSYLTHDGIRDLDKDIELFEKLRDARPPHYSPFEHVATPAVDHEFHANFRSWIQTRRFVEAFSGCTPEQFDEAILTAAP